MTLIAKVILCGLRSKVKILHKQIVLLSLLSLAISEENFLMGYLLNN